MSDKENPCEKMDTELCPIISDLYDLQNKYHKLENEKYETERKLKHLRKTIADNNVSYPDSYIDYVTSVVGNVRTVVEWAMPASAFLCVCLSITCAIAYARSESINVGLFSTLGIFTVILVLSTIGCITIPTKETLHFMIKEYMEHKKAEKVVEFYRLFPMKDKED